MRNSSKLLIAFLLVVFFRNWAIATPLVDQQQQEVDTNVGGLAIGGSSQQILAQVVTAGISGILTEVRFPVACAFGNLVIEVQGATGGIPDGVVLTSQTIPGDNLPPFFIQGDVSFRSLVFSVPASISAGGQFAIVLSSPGQCAVSQGPVGDSYQGGNALFIALPNPLSEWVCMCDFAGARFDLPFQTLLETTQQVKIDIKPYSFTNSINPRSKGVIPVAILTTDSFDATAVDPTTVLFGITGAETAPVHYALEDVDGNGDIDMILHFKTQQTGIQCQDTFASLTGQTISGQIIQGSDSVDTVGCK